MFEPLRGVPTVPVEALGEALAVSEPLPEGKAWVKRGKQTGRVVTWRGIRSLLDLWFQARGVGYGVFFLPFPGFVLSERS